MTNQVQFVQVTIGRDTREVEAVRTAYSDGTFSSWRSAKMVALFRKGFGGKLWKGTLGFREDKDGTLIPLFHGTFLNRAGYVAVAWNDEEFSKYLSQHNSLGQG